MFRCRSQRLINRSYSSLIFAPTVDSVLFKSVTYSDIMQQLIHRLLRIVNVLPFFGHCHWHPHRVTAVKHTIACGSYPNHPIRLAPPRAYAPQKTIKREPQNLEPPGKTLNSFEESSYSFIFRFHLCVFWMFLVNQTRWRWQRVGENNWPATILNSEGWCLFVSWERTMKKT